MILVTYKIDAHPLAVGHDQADPVTGRLAGVSQPLAEPAHLPPATERQVRSHAAELV